MTLRGVAGCSYRQETSAQVSEELQALVGLVGDYAQVDRNYRMNKFTALVANKNKRSARLAILESIKQGRL
jgi:pyrroline-5-carboxylate reductase